MHESIVLISGIVFTIAYAAILGYLYGLFLLDVRAQNVALARQRARKEADEYG